MVIHNWAERAAFISFRDWMGQMAIDGVEVDRIAVALGVTKLEITDEVRGGWSDDSIARMIWSVVGLKIEKIRGADVLRWADDVERGARLDCLREIRDMKREEGIDVADIEIEFSVVDWLEAHIREAFANGDALIMLPGEDPERYAARVDKCIIQALEEGMHIHEESCWNG